jgi:hypothetical protein
VQHLEDARLTDLMVARCIGCGLVQLENEPVPYWRETIDTADRSPSLNAFIRERSEGLDFYSRHRLEHMPDPVGYLHTLKGTGEVTVPNIVRLPVAEFFADHLLYFDADTLTQTLKFAGFMVQHVEVMWHGEILAALVKRPKVAVWGAGHQAFSVMRLMHLGADYIVDRAEFKHGKTVFGATISPPEHLTEEPPDVLYVIAGGYTDEVCKQAREIYGGRMVRFDDGRFVDAD